MTINVALKLFRLLSWHKYYDLLDEIA